MDVTVLKVEHHGADNARKLVPYIMACDIYCPENGFKQKARAEYVERDWNNTLRTVSSRTEFKRRLNFTDHEGVNAEPGATEFKIMTFESCFRNKKPLFYLERFTKEQAEELQRQYRAFGEAMHRGKMLYPRDCSMEQFYGGFKIFGDIGVARDREMARSLETLDEGVRRIYGDLVPARELAVCVEVGAAHCPERYMLEQPKAIVQLAVPADPFHDAVAQIREGAALDQAKDSILSAVRYMNLLDV